MNRMRWRARKQERGKEGNYGTGDDDARKDGRRGMMVVGVETWETRELYGEQRDRLLQEGV